MNIYFSRVDDGLLFECSKKNFEEYSSMLDVKGNKAFYIFEEGTTLEDIKSKGFYLENKSPGKITTYQMIKKNRKS